MAIKVTFAHPLSRWILLNSLWNRATRPSYTIPTFWPPTTPDRLEIRPSGLRIGATVFSEIGPMGLDGKLYKTTSWRKGKPVIGEEEIDYSIREAFCLAGVRNLDLPLQDADLAEKVLSLLINHSIQGFRALRSKHPEITVTKEQLPIEIRDPRSVARQLKLIAWQLKRASFPIRYDKEKLTGVIQGKLKDRDTDILSLLLLFSAPLGIWSLYFGGDPEIGPNAIAKELLSRQDISRQMILIALANSHSSAILQTIYDRLKADITEEETALLISRTLKYCQRYSGSHYCQEYMIKKLAPVLDLLNQLIDRPLSLDRKTLIDFSRSDFSLDPNLTEICVLRDRFCLKALAKVFGSLSQEEVLAYFNEKSPAPLSVRSELFNHPRLPESFCRQALLSSKEAVDNDVAAFQRLRPKITPAELSELAKRRHNSPALLVALINDADLPREGKLLLLRHCKTSWGHEHPDREVVLQAGLELLGDSLSPDEVAQLFPTGHQQIDIQLAKHPQLSKSYRLDRLLADIPFTRTASEWVGAGKPALLALLERSEQDFTGAEYRTLYNFLYGTEWRVDFELVEKILCNASDQPDMADIVSALYRQAALFNEAGRPREAAQVNFHEKRLEGIDWESAGRFSSDWDREGEWQVLVVRLYDVEFKIFLLPEDTANIERIMVHPKFSQRQKEFSAELGKLILTFVLAHSQFGQHIREKAAERGETIDPKFISGVPLQLSAGILALKDGN